MNIQRNFFRYAVLILHFLTFLGILTLCSDILHDMWKCTKWKNFFWKNHEYSSINFNFQIWNKNNFCCCWSNPLNVWSNALPNSHTNTILSKTKSCDINLRKAQLWCICHPISFKARLSLETDFLNSSGNKNYVNLEF